ncbi:diacylglycerol kinase family protein [Flavobacteriaceae bacterium Ap0902]|nr:diacylglycerol kinase family protein [Flavobacteriaceae bacterium Ap0902]
MIKKKKDSFIIDRLKSIRYALRGALKLIRTESSILAQSLVFLGFLLLGWYVGITPYEWIIQIICFGMVLTAEGLNTAIEKLCDFVHPDFHHKIGEVKDISAGAVTFSAGASFIVACFIYYPYFF